MEVVWAVVTVVAAVLVAVGWAVRGVVVVTDRTRRRAGAPRWPLGGRPWVRVVGDGRLAWVWTVLLAGAVALLVRARGDEVPVVAVVASSITYGLAWAVTAGVWALVRERRATGRTGLGLAQWRMLLSVLLGALVVSAWAVDAWLRSGG
ncbi:hypothetical protein [Cellulomonas carbonis]|uniref:Uncharacterized protein n=1 Tax=Cellulomonas carbonis T26 TaxID=947969 RepID=A0A0A0BSR8_9CELL|nr:hypothetical protein [Cellulomonas carbonis]KGM10970.1 hypothetical protein N868_12945 [Cellulomonas carbonis T26]GGC02455.1 hypothetical protein GCM10010972_14240 [Cellulomonas carbonis]